MAKKKTSQKNYSAADYLNIARDAEKKSSREAELRESRDATEYLNIARRAQGETPVSRRKEQKEEQQPVTAAEKLNRAALLMSRYPAAGDMKRQEINRMAGNLQKAAARNYKSNGQNWNLAGTGSVFDPIGTTAGRRAFEGGLDAELLKSNLEKLTQQQKKQQETEKRKKDNASLVKNGKGGGGTGFGVQTAREALRNESLTDRISRVQNALYEAEGAAGRKQALNYDVNTAKQRVADVERLERMADIQSFAQKYFPEKVKNGEAFTEDDFFDVYDTIQTAEEADEFARGWQLYKDKLQNRTEDWLTEEEMQEAYDPEKTADEKRGLNSEIRKAERARDKNQYEAAMDTDRNFDRLAEEGRSMDTRMKNAEEVLAYPHDKRAAAEAEKLVQYTTDAEKKTYYYTLRTQGQEAADDYLQTLDVDLNRRRGEAQLEATRQIVNSGWLGTVGANAYSVLSSVGETPAYITNLIRSLRGEEIDPYSSENMVSRVNEEIRNKTSQNIQEGVPGFGGKAASFGYNVIMDLARSRYNMMLGLGLGGKTKIGKWTSAALMGTSAAQSTLTDALDRGATDGQAVATSIASGVWETLFEEVSLERLLDLKSPKTVRQFLTNTLLQSATEGSEELFTEMANTVSDELIMRDLSNYRLNKKAYELSGMTPEEAQKNALADIAKNWGMAALGGFASGAVGAGTHQLLELGANRQQNRLQQAAQKANQTAQQTNRQETAQNLEQAAETAKQNSILNNNEQNVTNTKQTTETQRELARQAQYEGGGVSENVEIDRQNPVSRVKNGTVYLRTQDGSDVRASDVTFGDERDNLLAAEGVHRMSPSGISGMLENYDAGKATAEEYAKAYMAVYNRARAGMNVQQAVYDSQQTQNALTQEAAMAAYAAGERMQTVKIIPMTREEKTRRDAQLKLVEAINQKFAKTGVKIEMVDRIEGYGGQEMNGRWDSQTNTIQVSKNASENAYAYIAMHELTHAMKSQNASEFEGFSDWVTYYLNENGQDADALVRSEMIVRAQAMGLMERQKSNLSVEEQVKLLDSLSEEQYRQLNELAQEEVVCNTVPAILQNENVLMDLYQTKPTLFEKIKNFLKDFIDAVRGTGKDLSRTRAFQQMEGLAKDTAALEDIYNRMVKMAENGAQEQQAEGTRFSVKEEDEHYDHSKPFIQQVDDLLEGKVPKDDALLIGGTPDVLQKIGFSNLPLTMNAEHIKSMNRDTEHALSRAFMEQLPELIKNPLAVIESKTNQEGSTVILLNAVVNGKPYIAPAYITTTSMQNGLKIDSNNIATVFRKGNAITRMLTDAIQKENAGKTGVYYWKKSEARSLFESAGVQFPGGSMQDGLIHSIYDAGSTVNRKYLEQTETKQFKRWFGDSKVVDADGKPLVVYHATDADFTVFDREKLGQYTSENTDNEAAIESAKVGFWFSENDLREKTGNKKTMEVYLSIENPMETDLYTMLDVLENMTADEYRAELEEEGYDGLIVTDQEFDNAKSYVVFKPNQIKSATDNVGTFDYFNPDIRYSLKETDEDVKKQVELTGEIMRQTGGYRLTEADAERVMRRVTKEFGSQADVSQLTKDFARVMEYARQENADMNQVDNELLSLADRVLENSAQMDTEREQEMKPIREKLRKTAISLTDRQKAEAASLTGSLGAFRRALFGRVNLSQKNGVSLDSVWSELSDLSPTLFPADATEGDMPRLLMEAVDATKPVFENQYSMNSEEMTQYAVMQMMDQYMQLPGVKTAAKNQQRMGLTASQYREIMDAFRKKSEKTFQDAWVKVWMQKEKAGKAEAEARYREWKQDKRQEMRDWRKEQQQAMQEKYREWRRADTETRKNREEVNTYRDRLERTTNTLLRWMEKPNQTQHIPEGLAADVQKVLTGLDFSGKNTLAAKDLGSRIDALAGRIFELQEKTDENGATNQTFYLERDQQMVDELHHLAAKIGASNGSVYELSASELKDLNQWMAAVKHVITDVNKNHAKYYQGKFYRGESQYHTIEEVADATKAELHQRRAYADKKGVTRAWNELLGKGMIDCFSFFDKMGSAGQEVFGNLRKGFDKHVRNVDAAKTYTEKVLEGIDQKELRQWTDEKKRTEYKTDRGETIRLNTAEVMELYVLSKREQAQSHLYGQGIRTNEKVEPVMLTRGDVSRITGTLTDGQKQIADKLQRFLAQDCASWGNEASRALVGYDKFGEKNYWPIRTDPNSNRTLNADGSAANLSYIKNQGFTKDVTEKAQNAIMVESIFGTYTRHISSMSAYNAYAVAMTDMQRWFNTPGVKTEIERAFGTNGTRYITDLMKQINGTADNGKTFGGAKDMVNKLVGHAKASAVGANLSVAIQQPTAYVRAADMISPKYLAAGLKGKTDIDLVKKWCPIAAWKSWGFYETDIGRGLNSLLVDQSTALERATEKSMVLAQKGDEITWKALWRAVEAETHDLYEGELEPGTDEFYERVGQRMSDIIDKTQVVDSVFHRSPIMRDRGFSAIYTSFMAEPIKTYNMVERAIANFAENRNDPAAKRKLMRTVAVYVLNGLAGAMAKSVIGAARDDDKEKNYWEKYLETLGENAMDNLLFTNNIPVVSDYLDTLRGNEPSRLDLQSIDRVRQLVNEVPKMIDGTSKWSTFKGMYKFAQMASDVTGVPAYAAIRDAKAIVQTVGDALGQDWYIPMQNETATFGYAAENLYEAIRKGDGKREERLRKKLGETKSPSQIDAAVAGVMMEQDSRIAEAAALKLQGKAAELNEKKAEIVADGFTAEMVDKAVNQYIASGQTAKEKDLTKELKANLWSRDEAVKAIRTAAGLEEGSATADDVKAIVSELVADSTAQDPAKTVKSGIISSLKKEYVSLTEEGKETEAKSLLGVMQETLDVTAEDAKGWVTEGHQESLRNAAEAMDVRALKAAMNKLKKDGKTDQSMKSSIEGVMKKQYTEAKTAGDRGQMEKIVRFLTGLELKNAKGEKYFTREKIEAWGEDD